MLKQVRKELSIPIHILIRPREGNFNYSKVEKEIILEEKKKNKVIILSTHLMDFAEKMCDHIAMINHGKIILNGSLNEIKKKYSQKNVSLTYEGDISFLYNHPIIDKISDYGNTIGIRVKDTSQIQQILKLLVEKNIVVKNFNANEISLQEIFIELAGKEEDVLEVKNV